MLFIILVLMAFGPVMLFSASYANAYYRTGNSYHYVLRQGIFALAGVVAMLAISTVDYHQLHRLNILIAGVSALLLVLVILFLICNCGSSCGNNNGCGCGSNNNGCGCC